MLSGSCSQYLAVNNDTTVGVDGLATNGRRVGASEEDETCRDLAGLAGPAHGGCELILCFMVHGGRDERCPNGAGCDSVDTDASADVLVGETTREGHDGALGGCVVEKIGTADVGVDGGVVDDCVALLHVGKAVLGEVEVWVDVDVEGVLPLLPIELLVIM